MISRNDITRLEHERRKVISLIKKNGNQEFTTKNKEINRAPILNQ